MATVRGELQPGTRVRVTQQVVLGADVYTTDVTGTVLSHAREPTGSWYAYAPGGRLQLERLRLRKDDGEITTLVIDDHTVVTHLPMTSDHPDATANTPAA